MKRRMSMLLVLVVFVLAAAGAALSQGDDSLLGGWKLNVAKSKYRGAKPKSETRTYTLFSPGSTVANKSSSNPNIGGQVLGPTIHLTVAGTNGDGNVERYEWVGRTDGKDDPINGLIASGADTQSIESVDANTFSATAKEAGKELYNERIEISQDGKIMTITTKGKDADGKPFDSVRLYDKQ